MPASNCTHTRRRIATMVLLAYCGSGTAAPLTLSQLPMFVAANSPANVLMLFSNSNSMDEDPTGLAVGSASPSSKSEIARGVIKSMVSTYAGTVNMGLMAFQQTTSGNDPIRLQALHQSPYDASYNPANYDPTYTGNRKSNTKKFRVVNSSDPTRYVYYNVNLPFYADTSQGDAFCYSSTANAFNNGENPSSGPWDSYDCYRTKTGTSDGAPGTSGAGYGNFLYQSTFSPTDSDLGQGITDFGTRTTWSYVSDTWFSNRSPGLGYVHIPISYLDATQQGKFNTKLGRSQFSTNAPFSAAYPLQNAGLTPLQGSLLTARTYFQGGLSDSAQGGPLPAPPNSCGKNFLVALTNGLPSVDRYGNPSSNVTQMLADVTAQASDLYRLAGVSTYVVGFALPYGVNPTQLDAIAAAGNTQSAFSAADQTTLTQTLTTVFADIIARSGSAAAVSVNSSQLSAGSRVFQGRFNSGDWSGQLLSFSLNTDGSLGTQNWDAGQVINTQAPGARRILTYKPSTNAGIPFRWPALPATPASNELDPAQVLALNTSANGVVDSLGSQRIDYLRGSAALEGGLTTDFRRRGVSRLGDIVNSMPQYVGAPSASNTDPAYLAFRATYANRTPVVYAGANDGMLHAFNAGNGTELFGYVPSGVYPYLSRLTGQSYSHRYFVDGSPVVSDVKVNGAWRTYLVSPMGAGARGLFVLDVTDPSAFSESNASSIVRFEFNEASDGDVGFITGRPSIVRLNNGSWAAVFGGGYNGTATGKASLYVVDLASGTLIRKLSTSVGSVTTPNGLSSASVVDLDGNQTADYVYAGDQQGNLWKFDLSDANPTQWSVAYGGAPLFSTANAGVGQLAITTKPEVARHPLGGYMVVFGTGKLLESGDLTSSVANYFFGVRDNGAALASGSQLQLQSVTGTTTGPDGNNYRLTSTTPVDFGSKVGWYLKLPESGERNVTDPLIVDGRAVFTTMTPSTAACSAGGTSWLMELDFLTGARLKVPALDVNADGTVTTTDKLSGNIPSGRQVSSIASMPVILNGAGSRDAPLKIKQMTLSSGSVASVTESGNPQSTRRTAWQQLR